jgi:hypothetical protein
MNYLATVFLAAGMLIYSASFRRRRSLDVPFLLKREKQLVGGILIFIGLVILATLWIGR